MFNKIYHCDLIVLKYFSYFEVKSIKKVILIYLFRPFFLSYLGEFIHGNKTLLVKIVFSQYCSSEKTINPYLMRNFGGGTT